MGVLLVPRQLLLLKTSHKMITLQRRVGSDPLDFSSYEKKPFHLFQRFFPPDTTFQKFFLTSHWPDYRLPLSLNKRNETLKSNDLKQCFSHLNILRSSLQSLRKHQTLDLTLRISEFSRFGVGPKILHVYVPRWCWCCWLQSNILRPIDTEQLIYPLWHWGEVRLPEGRGCQRWVKYLVSVSQKITSCLVTQKHWHDWHLTAVTWCFHVVSKSWLRVNLNLEIEFCLNRPATIQRLTTYIQLTVVVPLYLCVLIFPRTVRFIAFKVEQIFWMLAW